MQALLIATLLFGQTDLERSFIEWASEAALPVNLAEGLEAKRLAPLVGPARVVYLGEPDHFVDDKYAFRLTFLEALHELGWRHLGMEMGHSDGRRFDRYLATGDEADLLDVGLYGSVSSLDSAIERGGFLGAEMNYARRLRALATGTERFRYFGFDLDMLPGNGWDDALAHVADLGDDHELTVALRTAGQAPERADRLGALAAEIAAPNSSWSRALGDQRCSALALDLFVYAESLSFRTSSAQPFTGFEEALEPYRRRESVMYRVFDETWAALEPGAKVVLTGHNMHLSCDSEGARWVDPGDFLPIPLWRTIGTHVAERLPDDVYSIWMVYDHGEQLVSAGGLETRPVDSLPGTLESLLAQVPHETFLLPLSTDDPRAAWLDDERRFRVNGGCGWGHLLQLTDAVFFVRAVQAP